ncbi:MAG: adenylate/guanylate cyclase domain-containing protein [Chloroflexota bacterium]
MDCPSCGLTYPAEFRFCPTCGIALTSSRPEAPAVGAGGVHDAHGVAESRPSLAERRLVSVLFLDLVGFTTLSESLDPEDVREIQSLYFEAARAAVAHYGGSLEKFIGDAVMAVWGTPVAHEDDAERAVRTALEVVAAVETIASPGSGHLVARAAITTGEAAVTVDATGQGMVTGDLVNTASRLQSAAEPGTVLVDDVTRRVIGQAIEFQAAGDQLLKGKASAVAAWRAVGVAQHPGTESRAGHPGPFVGRDAELRALLELLSAVGDEHRMRVVSVIGIAGIGKSRLAWELEQRAGDAAARARWQVGRAPAYGEGTAFAPLADVVRRSAGIAESDPVELVRRALGETLNRLLPDDAEREWMEPRLLALLEPSGSQEAQREELFAAWRRFFEAQADEGPIALVFEDLQWADPGLLDFIDYVADWSRHRPILVLTLGRPELLDARPTWGAGLPHFTAMHLDRLPDEAIDELLAALAPGLSPQIVTTVRRRADGVPLYAVEMARMLMERSPSGGVESTADIPESLHALIAARIDALPAADRALLLTGAVLGRRFAPESLAALSGADPRSFGERVRALLRREFLSMDDEPRSPGRGQLSFVQELVREVAYYTLSRRQRRTRHLEVVAYLESLDDPDLAEPIAEHLLAALTSGAAPQPEDAAIAGRAREALQLAADRAQALHAPVRALTHLEDALKLTDLPAARADLAEAAGLAARSAARFDRAEEHLRDAIGLREGLHDAAGASRHRAQLASLLLQAQRSDTALAELEAAWTAATAGGDGASVPPELPAELARAHLLRGDRPRAVEWAERAIAAAEANGDTGAAIATAIDARITLGTARAEEGAAEGLELLRRSIEDAEAADLGRLQLRALNNLAWVTVSDDPQETSRTARRGLDLANRLGSREMALQLVDVASVVAVDIGDWDWAMTALADASSGELPTVYRVDFAVTQTVIRAMRGIAEASRPIEGIGDLEADLDLQAVGSINHARAMVEMSGGRFSDALDLARAATQGAEGFEEFEALALAGRLAAWSGDADGAAQASDALDAHRLWGRSAEAARQTLRAAVASQHAASSAAEREWAAALGAWRELDLPLRLALCHLDRWFLAGHVDDQASAREIFERLGATSLATLSATSARYPLATEERQRS